MRGKANYTRLLLCILFTTLSAQAQYGGGSGKAEDPYLIYAAEQMNTIGNEPNDWDKHFKLVADIDLKDYGDSSFNLIGSYSHPFKGVFDGNGHTISNLTYVVTGNEEPADDRIMRFGLFRHIDDPNAVIKDLSIVNPDVRPASTCQKWVWIMGALAGSLGSGSIRNCSIEGGQVQGERMIGGLVGSNRGIISDCYTTCTVSLAEQRSLPQLDGQLERRESFGGLVGENRGEISNCHTTGKVSGERRVGGLVGETSGIIISNSWSSSDVSGDVYIGGLVGTNRIKSKLSCCYATGHVSGRNSIGGLVGKCYSEASIDSCNATGSVSAEENGGGLVGSHEGTLSECYSTAFVFIETNNAGGLVGHNWGTIHMSCAHGHVSGKTYVGGLVGINPKHEDPYFKYDPVVTDSYSSGSVYGEDVVGGLIGQNQEGTVLRCYSTAKVTGATAGSWTGGLVSVNVGDIPVENSFWDTEASGVNRSDGGEGKTTAEMQNMWMYLSAGWDFVDQATNGTEDIWWILEGKDYPRLWWQYGRAFAPYPLDGATDVIQPLLLNWAPGGSNLSYDVYFGEDEQVVANATTERPITYRGRQAPDITSYDPGNLRLARTYYWRIDEINEADPNNTWKGCVWSFTTADYILIDDFESYRDHDNEVWYSWHDGLGYGGPGFERYYPGNGTGSAVGDETWQRGSHMEILIVYGGRQSMPYSYDNNKPGFLKYSEATLTLDYPRNWTEGGVEVLSLRFYGDSNNAPEPMYVAVANTNGPTVVVYHDNPDAALIDSWMEWTIDLQEFADKGVNLTDVDSIAIGFGGRDNPQPGGSGRMYFDDIRLCGL